MASMNIRSPYWGLMALLAACAGTPKQVDTIARTDLGCEDIEIAEIAKDRYATQRASLRKEKRGAWLRRRRGRPTGVRPR